MRKTLLILSALSIAALTTQASAQPTRYGAPRYVAPVAGAAVGTVVGVGLYNGWFGTSAAVAAFPASAVGAAVTGGIAGVGTIALIDAIVRPCHGFQMLLGPAGCVDGEYVGDQVPVRRRAR